MTPEAKAREIVARAIKRQEARKQGAFRNKVPFTWDSIWGTEGQKKSLCEEIAQALQAERNQLLAIIRVADEMRPYMNQFKGAAVDELKSRYDRLRGREILK